MKSKFQGEYFCVSALFLCRADVLKVFMSLSLNAAVVFQVPVLSWFDDVEDTELLNLLPVFEELSGADDVYAKLRQLREP